MPVRDTKIVVGGQFQIISPGFCAHADTPVFTGEIIIKEGIGTIHPVPLEGTNPGPHIDRIAAVFITGTELGKENGFFIIIQRDQNIGRTAVQMEVIINIQLYASSTELTQPLLC
ncbi:Uncharacterised protein [Yersinia pseudotuberculosis]|nr:Uncharacterised protein [Yersinia pseudotuberculosis]